jgi:hypothetical protein
VVKRKNKPAVPKGKHMMPGMPMMKDADMKEKRMPMMNAAPKKKKK